MIPSEIAKERRKTVKRLTGIDDDWDLYINPDLKNGANEIKAKSVKDNNGFSAVHVGTGHSNVAILHSCYQGMSATERKKEEFYLFAYLPLASLYNGYFLRLARLRAHTSELFFFTSYKDPWNPRKTSVWAQLERT